MRVHVNFSLCYAIRMEQHIYFPLEMPILASLIDNLLFSSACRCIFFILLANKDRCRHALNSYSWRFLLTIISFFWGGRGVAEEQIKHQQHQQQKQHPNRMWMLMMDGILHIYQLWQNCTNIHFYVVKIRYTAVVICWPGTLLSFQYFICETFVTWLGYIFFSQLIHCFGVMSLSNI